MTLSFILAGAAPGQVFVATPTEFDEVRATTFTTPSIAELLGETVESKGLMLRCSPILCVWSRLSH